MVSAQEKFAKMVVAMVGEEEIAHLLQAKEQPEEDTDVYWNYLLFGDGAQLYVEDYDYIKEQGQ